MTSVDNIQCIKYTVFKISLKFQEVKIHAFVTMFQGENLQGKWIYYGSISTDNVLSVLLCVLFCCIFR